MQPNQEMIKLETELRNIKGINEKFLTKLDKLKLKTVRDLLWHFPFRYDDFSTVVKIADLKINQAATVRGIVKKVSLRRSWLGYVPCVCPNCTWVDR